jgi:hypothetical protein
VVAVDGRGRTRQDVRQVEEGRHQDLRLGGRGRRTAARPRSRSGDDPGRTTGPEQMLGPRRRCCVTQRRAQSSPKPSRAMATTASTASRA